MIETERFERGKQLTIDRARVNIHFLFFSFADNSSSFVVVHLFNLTRIVLTDRFDLVKRIFDHHNLIAIAVNFRAFIVILVR